MPLYRAELLAKKPLRYAALIHDVSQVLYLPFDWDDGSYARDRSGYNNHGTIYGATLATGKIGMARTFDGVDDYVKVPHDPSITFTSEDFTVAMWIKWLTFETLKPFITKGSWRADGWYIETTGTAAILISTNQAGASQTTNTFDFITLNTWYYIAVVRKGADATIYVDGVDKTNVKGTHIDPAFSTRSLYVAAYDMAIKVSNVVMDEIRLYNRALSRDEIRMLMYRRLI